MATKDFVSVAADDWYQRRRNDAEGEFFRKVADQSPRKGEGGSTRQGIYCMTADGKLLAYKNAGQDADVMRQVFRDALSRWAKLPEAERRPGAQTIGSPSKTDANYDRSPPAGAAVVNVFTRILDRGDDGSWAKCASVKPAHAAAARDHLWMTEADLKELLPVRPRIGQTWDLPPVLVRRILRFHFVDATRGEPNFWRNDEIRNQDLRLTVTDVTPELVRLRLEGSVRLATNAEPKSQERGYEARVLGLIAYRPAERKLTQFDVVAIGDHWGEGTFTRGARAGKTPLGIAFGLAPANDPARGVAPQGARELREYLGRR